MKLIISDSNHVVYLQTQNIAEFAGRMARFLPQQPPKQKKLSKKRKKWLTNLFPYSIIQIVQFIGLSPNGKATDSDSVIFKVRILVAQLKSICLPKTAWQVLFCIMETPSEMFHNTTFFNSINLHMFARKQEKNPRSGHPSQPAAGVLFYFQIFLINV